MPSGVGPNIIIPGGQGLWQAITGQSVWDSQNNPVQMFGADPMGAANRTMDYGRLGGFTSYGPQGTTYQRPGFPLGDPAGAGLNTALFGSSYNPAAGQSAYDRFNDADASYMRRYATDAVDPVTGRVLIESPERSAGQRSGALFGGRGETGQPLFGSQYDTARNLAGIAQLQQGANPYLNNPTLAAQMSQYQELASPFARANPAQYLQTMLGAEGRYPTTGDVGAGFVGQMGTLAGADVGRMGAMTGGMYSGVTGDVGRMANAYEQSLMDQIANQGSKDLSLGLQDAQSTLSSMGLGRSGQGQSTAAGVWSDIQEKNAMQRQNIMAQYRQAAMEREAQTATTMGAGAMDANARAILAAQGGGINALLAAQQAAVTGNESRLGRANQAAMGGLAAQTASLEASRAAERQQLLGGMDRTAQWNTGVQGNYLQALQSGDTAALNRMTAEANAQSQGLHDYMALQQTKDQMRTDRLNEMLGLEDRYRTSQNEVLNQMAQYGQMPISALMQMITGISPTGAPQARTNPWLAIGGQLGSAAIGALPGAYASYRGQYDPANHEG